MNSIEKTEVFFSILFLCLMIFLSLYFSGCAAGTLKTFTIEGAGTVRICSIASDNQIQTGETSTEISGDQLGGSLIGRGLLSGFNIVIKMATPTAEIKDSGLIDIKEAGVRNQGIQIDGLMERLFKPGYPFPFEKNYGD